MLSGSPIVAAFERAAQLRAQRIASTNSNSASLVNGTSASVESDSLAHDATEQEEVQGTMSGTSRKHKLHHVLPIETKRSIVHWMTTEASNNGENRLMSKTVRMFPQFFKGSQSANHMRARRLWNDRALLSQQVGTGDSKKLQSSISRVTSVGRQRCRLKAQHGRGRKRTAWVLALHEDLRAEFDRLRRLGVKFSISTLQELALHILCNEGSDAYSRNMLDPRSNQALHLKIDGRWVQSFMERFNIVSRARTGKHSVSPTKQNDIEISVAAHLGCVSALFDSNRMDENYVENCDETHFMINLDNGHTLGFSGEKEVKYADVVSGGEGFTMVVRLTGGRDARVAPPFMVFKNADSNYPIRNVPDTVPGVAYRTGKKGWMDRKVMCQWLSESRVITEIPNHRRLLYLDNCSGHTETPELLEASAKINTEIRYFPPNTTHLIQPCDSFIIQKIKRTWTNHWEAYKMDMIAKGRWKDSAGKIHNPGKSYFLQLAARCVREVNQQRDEDGVSVARKAMIITGMALNTNGVWEIRQLNPGLQRIIQKHKSVFEATRSDT